MGSNPAPGGYKYRDLVLRDGGWAWGSQPYPVKKKIVEKPPRNSAEFCGGDQGLSWAVEPREEEEEEEEECMLRPFEVFTIMFLYPMVSYVPRDQPLIQLLSYLAHFKGVT
jgi:hypothetical protein